MSKDKSKEVKKPTRRRMKAPANPLAEGAAGASMSGNPRAGEADLMVPEEERRRMIQEEAYLRAEQQGFPGNSEQDWLEAEREVDQRLGRH